jgi:hypothetical protein
VSFRQNQQPGQYFRESLTYEEKIGNQVSVCLKAFNENDSDFMHSAVDALLVMTPVRLYDEQFSGELLDLDETWEGEKRRKMKAWERRLAEAEGGCPDVIRKPSLQPDRSYWERKFVMLVNLFDRRGIGLKLEKTDSL